MGVIQWNENRKDWNRTTQSNAFQDQVRKEIKTLKEVKGQNHVEEAKHRESQSTIRTIEAKGPGQS